MIIICILSTTVFGSTCVCMYASICIWSKVYPCMIYYLWLSLVVSHFLLHSLCILSKSVKIVSLWMTFFEIFDPLTLHWMESRKLFRIDSLNTYMLHVLVISTKLKILGKILTLHRLGEKFTNFGQVDHLSPLVQTESMN